MTGVDDRLDEIAARANAATDGPWWGASKTKRKDGIGIVGVGKGEDAAPIAVLAGARQTIKDRCANTAFIAAAREDVPWLVERLRDAQAEIERQRTIGALHAQRAGALHAKLTDEMRTERDAARAALARIENVLGDKPPDKHNTGGTDAPACAACLWHELRASLGVQAESE